MTEEWWGKGKKGKQEVIFSITLKKNARWHQHDVLGVKCVNLLVQVPNCMWKETPPHSFCLSFRDVAERPFPQVFYCLFCRLPLLSKFFECPTLHTQCIRRIIDSATGKYSFFGQCNIHLFVCITEVLAWSSHIDNLVRKANCHFYHLGCSKDVRLPSKFLFLHHREKSC